MSDPAYSERPQAVPQDDAATADAGQASGIDPAMLAHLEPAEQARLIAQAMGAPMPLPDMTGGTAQAGTASDDVPLEPHAPDAANPATLAAQQLAWAEAQARAQMEAEELQRQMAQDSAHPHDAHPHEAHAVDAPAAGHQGEGTPAHDAAHAHAHAHAHEHAHAPAYEHAQPYDHAQAHAQAQTYAQTQAYEQTQGYEQDQNYEQGQSGGQPWNAAPAPAAHEAAHQGSAHRSDVPVYDAANYAAQPSGAVMPEATFDPHHGGEAHAAHGAEDLSHIRPIPRISIQAFCETPGVAAVLEATAADRRMSKAHCKVQEGGIPAAVQLYQENTTPNLILLETKRTGPDLIAELEQLAEVCDEGTNVVVIGHRNDISLYRDLIARGVAEYLVAPLTMASVMEIVNALFVNPGADPLGHSIAFVGAKGGVGSSTIAHNVAWIIASQFESDVVLADLDLAFGTANIDFDQDPQQGIAEAVFSSDALDDTYLDRLLAKCSDHLSLLAAPSTLDREYDFEETAFDTMIEVAQRGTPNVVLDVPHSWNAWTKHLLAEADKVVITATPDLACLRNTKNLVDVLRELRPNDDKPFLVLNQVGVPKRPEIDVADFADPLELTPAAVFGFEPALFGAAANNGQMIGETDAKHQVANDLVTLSQMITGRRELTSGGAKGGIGGLLAKLMGRKG